MIILELWECCHSKEEQTAFDRFMFGAWKNTPKNFWSKKSGRVTLGFQFFINLMIILCFVVMGSEGYGSTSGIVVTNYANAVKNFEGWLNLAEAMVTPMIMDPVLEFLGIEECGHPILGAIFRRSIFASAGTKSKTKHKPPEQSNSEKPKKSVRPYSTSDFLMSHVSIYLGTLAYAALSFWDVSCGSLPDLEPADCGQPPDHQCEGSRSECMPEYGGELGLWQFDHIFSDDADDSLKMVTIFIHAICVGSIVAVMVLARLYYSKAPHPIEMPQVHL